MSDVSAGASVSGLTNNFMIGPSRPGAGVPEAVTSMNDAAQEICDGAHDEMEGDALRVRALAANVIAQNRAAISSMAQTALGQLPMGAVAQASMAPHTARYEERAQSVGGNLRAGDNRAALRTFCAAEPKSLGQMIHEMNLPEIRDLR